MKRSLWKSRLKGFKSCRWWMDPRKTYFFQTKQLHTAAPRNHDSMHKTCTDSSKTKSQHGEGSIGTKSYPTARSHLQLMPAGEGKMDFLQWDKPNYINLSPAGLMVRNSWQTQNGLHIFCVLCLDGGVVVVWCFAFLSFVVFLFLCFWMGTEVRGAGGLGRGDRKWSKCIVWENLNNKNVINKVHVHVENNVIFI